MIKFNRKPYNPISKLRAIQADVINTLGDEEAMTFIRKYHNEGDDGSERVYETLYGDVKVYSDETTIHVAWA